MLLGYNTNGFTSHALDDATDVIAAIGYASIGVSLDHSVLNPFEAGLDARAAAYRQRLEGHGLVPVIETGARFLLDPWRKHRPTLVSLEAAERERRADFLRRAIDVAAMVGAGVVSLWAGAADDAPGRDALDDRLAEQLIGVCRYAAERGVVIGFEPEPGMHIESMADFDRIDAMVDHPAFQLTLDVGHAHLTEDSAEQTVRRYADRIVNVHLEGMRRPHHDHLVPWEGDMDVRAVVRELDSVGFSGPATLELSRHSHAAVDTARRAYEFLQNASGSDRD